MNELNIQKIAESSAFDCILHEYPLSLTIAQLVSWSKNNDCFASRGVIACEKYDNYPDDELLELIEDIYHAVETNLLHFNNCEDLSLKLSYFDTNLNLKYEELIASNITYKAENRNIDCLTDGNEIYYNDSNGIERESYIVSVDKNGIEVFNRNSNDFSVIGFSDLNGIHNKIQLIEFLSNSGQN